ncbi:MAG: hypothetical protein K9N46_14930 [Candidatus Marinimicrobia bacterium]|nr:hypothetical protein [Candidatus Neomarinimicrobiota bacterium]MCF7829575.1 hypothetical protein [Candidatus Neomarinimicrobiota bacterium]MCF7882025.1 hypothetical protein [Candidatus Neomarinimicrobiota bacterium]
MRYLHFSATPPYIPPGGLFGGSMNTKDANFRKDGIFFSLCRATRTMVHLRWVKGNPPLHHTPLHNPNLWISEIIQVIYQLIDLLVGGGDAALQDDALLIRGSLPEPGVLPIIPLPVFS